MSDPTAQEPTMEEILASIRRIISEDDAPAAEPAVAETVHAVAEAERHPEPVLATVAAAAPAPTPVPAAVHVAAVAPAVVEEDDVLELTEPAPKPKETHGDLDVFDAEPVAKPEPVKVARLVPEPVQPAPVKVEEPIHTPSFSSSLGEERLISDGTEDRAYSHFGKLSRSIAMPPGGRNLEDVVVELLKPLLKDWLDEHLPGIVEEKVEAEVERIARRRV